MLHRTDVRVQGSVNGVNGIVTPDTLNRSILVVVGTSCLYNIYVYNIKIKIYQRL